MTPEPQSSAAFAGLVRKRRTNLRVDPDTPVANTTIEDLCRLATWAPNHKLTEPWRFAALTGEARRRLGDITADFIAGQGADAARVEKTREKYLRAPVIVVVASAADEDPVRHLENRDAVAAGIQNMLLGATSAGLNSYWGTGPAARNPMTNTLCGFDQGDEVVAVIYLGWPTGNVPVPGRAKPRITWVGESAPT